jgi:hypothetical protein
VLWPGRGTVAEDAAARQLDTLFWNWRPKTCSLRPLDRKRFGQLLRNEKVVFVGDSLVNQLASST